jgi:hypothetical protein
MHDQDLLNWFARTHRCRDAVRWQLPCCGRTLWRRTILSNQMDEALSRHRQHSTCKTQCYRRPLLEKERAYIKRRGNECAHITARGLRDELAGRGIKVSYDTVSAADS